MGKRLSPVLLVGLLFVFGCEIEEGCDPATDANCGPDSGADAGSDAGHDAGHDAGSCIESPACTPGNTGDLDCRQFCMESVCFGMEDTNDAVCVETQTPYCYCVCNESTAMSCLPPL
jgi:hypothetical protein